MRPIYIFPKIIKALGFSEEEESVFNVVLKMNSIFGASVSEIARRADVPRMTCRRIIDRLEKRGLLVKVKNLSGKSFGWKYQKGSLEKFKL